MPEIGWSRWRLPLIGAIAFAVVLAGCGSGTLTPASSGGSSPSQTAPTATTRVDAGAPNGMQAAEVVRVVDGDTLVVTIDGREERLRYIGVNTPETVKPNSPVECYGKQASRANAALVEGRTVLLEKDISERDRYGRLLRYVYVAVPGESDLVFVNLRLVEEGYAQTTTYPPDVRYEQTFRAAQRAAREARRGLWGACGG